MLKLILCVIINTVLCSNYGLLLKDIEGKRKYKNGLNTPIYFNDTSCYYYIDFDNINDVYYENVKNLFIVEIPESEKLIIKNITTYNSIMIYCSNMIILKENIKKKEFNAMMEIIYILTPDYLEKFYIERFNETDYEREDFYDGENSCTKKKFNIMNYKSLIFTTTLFSKNELFNKYYMNSLYWIMKNIDVASCSSRIPCPHNYPWPECYDYYDINFFGEENIKNLIKKLKSESLTFNKKILSILTLAMNDEKFNTYLLEFLKR